MDPEDYEYDSDYRRGRRYIDLRPNPPEPSPPRAPPPQEPLQDQAAASSHWYRNWKNRRRAAMRWQQSEWARTGRQYAVGHPAAAAAAASEEPLTWADYPALRDQQVEMAEYSPPRGTAQWGPGQQMQLPQQQQLLHQVPWSTGQQMQLPQQQQLLSQMPWCDPQATTAGPSTWAPSAYLSAAQQQQLMTQRTPMGNLIEPAGSIFQKPDPVAHSSWMAMQLQQRRTVGA